MGIIKTKNLVYNYIKRDEEEKIEEVSEAVKNVSLDIKEGEFVAILGHNGSVSYTHLDVYKRQVAEQRLDILTQFRV